jgi:hypothetical protein
MPRGRPKASNVAKTRKPDDLFLDPTEEEDTLLNKISETLECNEFCSGDLDDMVKEEEQNYMELLVGIVAGKIQ